MLSAFLRLLILSTAFLAAHGGFAHETIGIEPSTEAFNPVLFLRQAVAVLLPAEAGFSADAATSPPQLSIAFADAADSSRVNLVLAQSQLRVRLGRALQLQCEVSTRDELDAAPEIGIDIGLRVEFE